MPDLVARFRRQAEQCARAGSPLTATLLAGAAQDLAAGGVVEAVLTGEGEQPAGSVPALRLAGALHRLVLEGRATRLAAFYPSVGGSEPVAGVWPVAAETLREQLDEVRRLVRHPVQTNEVGRSAALYGALVLLVRRYGLPVRLLEIGASGGLNLHPDRYAYEVADGVTLGDPASRVRLHRPWEGQPPLGLPLVVRDRAGCDPRPLDPASSTDRLTLMSYVWADQTDRLARLGRAMALAAAQPVRVEAASASAFLARQLAVGRPGVVTVVWQSVVHQYLSPAERLAVDDVVAKAGAAATPGAPLARVAFEPGNAVTGGFPYLLRLTHWPGPRPRTLAHCEGHGPPVRWLAHEGDSVDTIAVSEER